MGQYGHLPRFCLVLWAEVVVLSSAPGLGGHEVGHMLPGLESELFWADFHQRQCASRHQPACQPATGSAAATLLVLLVTMCTILYFGSIDNKPQEYVYDIALKINLIMVWHFSNSCTHFFSPDLVALSTTFLVEFSRGHFLGGGYKALLVLVNLSVLYDV